VRTRGATLLAIWTLCFAPANAVRAGVQAPTIAFTDLSLAQAESAALQRSPDVAGAQAIVRERQALFSQAEAAYGPALVGDYTQGPQGGANGTTVTQRLATVGAEITLGNLLAYAPLVAEAHARLVAARFALWNVERREREKAVRLYFSALQAYAAARVREEALAAAQAQERAAWTRFSTGDAPRLDVIRASVAVAKAKADLAAAESTQANAMAALASEVGTVPEVAFDSGAAGAAASGAVPAVRAAIAQALRTRPEIVSAQQNVAAEEQAVAVARRGILPALTITAGYTRGVDSGIAVSGPTAGIRVSFPVGGAAHDRVAAEEARLDQAKARLETARRRIALEVGSAVRTYAAQIAALQAARRAADEATKELKATEIGYRAGASTSLDVDIARATFVSAVSGEVAAQYASAQSRATLQLLTGG
jgi:outer membrane protein TolC